MGILNTLLNSTSDREGLVNLATCSDLSLLIIMLNLFAANCLFMTNFPDVHTVCNLQILQGHGPYGEDGLYEEVEDTRYSVN